MASAALVWSRGMVRFGAKASCVVLGIEAEYRDGALWCARERSREATCDVLGCHGARRSALEPSAERRPTELKPRRVWNWHVLIRSRDVLCARSEPKPRNEGECPEAEECLALV